MKAQNRADKVREKHEGRGDFVRPRCCGFAMRRVCERTRRAGKLRWQPCGWRCTGECGRLVRDSDIEIVTGQ